jgi:hypothetical protein
MIQELENSLLRFAIICDGPTLEKWQMDCVRNILSLKLGTLAQIIRLDNGTDSGDEMDRESILFSIYSKVFARPPQKEQVPIDRLFSMNSTSNSNDAQSPGTIQIEPSNATKLGELNLDFALNFGSGPIPAELVTIPRYGVWSFRNDDGTETHGLPDCFWQVYNGRNVTGIVLERLSEAGKSSTVIWKGCFKTIRGSYSKNLEQALSGCASWPAQACTRIRNGGAEFLTGDNAEPGLKSHSTPSNLQVLLFLAKILKRRIEAVYRLSFRYTSWNVGIVDSPITAFLAPNFRPTVRWLPQSRNGHIQADPFGRSNGHKVTILFERLDYKQRKGTICAVETEDNLSFSEPRIVIELPVHMSYPFLFDHAGETYCVPETNQAKEISIYKAIEFPNQWIKVGHLLENKRAIDATVFQHNNRWWMMFTDREGGGDANLYVWHAPNLWGAWEAHPLNPVKTDIRSARPGGTPFEYEGHLYRPAQDCSKTGGGSIVVNRIKRLTTTEFQEETVVAVMPYPDTPYRKGLHTLSAAGEFTLIDGKRFRFIPTGLLTNIIRGLKKIGR